MLPSSPPRAPFDVVMASTLFTSMLDSTHRQRVADVAWRLVKPGGAALLYDFSGNQPWNRRVRKLPLREVRALFPRASRRVQRITLAPPIARHVPYGCIGSCIVVFGSGRASCAGWEDLPCSRIDRSICHAVNQYTFRAIMK